MRFAIDERDHIQFIGWVEHSQLFLADPYQFRYLIEGDQAFNMYGIGLEIGALYFFAFQTVFVGVFKKVHGRQKRRYVSGRFAGKVTTNVPIIFIAPGSSYGLVDITWSGIISGQCQIPIIIYIV